MIYLTFDSNIWIYLLRDSWKENNPMDYLEHWIEEGHVKILLPQIIHDEWENLKEKHRTEKTAELKTFFEMAEEILPSGFFSEYRKPEKMDEIIQQQFDRVEDVIKKSQTIPLTEEIRIKLIDWGIEKKAPMHAKSSIADAIIVLSLIQYADANSEFEYYFVSNNTEDFYEKNDNKKEIHKDLKPDFDRLGIKDYTALNHLMNDLRKGKKLPEPDIEEKRQNRIRTRLKESIFNPELIKGFKEFEDTYLESTKQIDHIIGRSNPTAKQLLLLFDLMRDTKLEEYFFQKVESPKWFPILKKQGFFSINQNPDPVPVGNGHSFPFWQSFLYLEKLSSNVDPKKDKDLIGEIIEIIKINLQNPKDNFRTSILIARILKNIPNEFISLEVVNLIPAWFDTSFGTSTQTSDLIEELLPKFVHDGSTAEDIEKGRSILQFLISVNKRELTDSELWFNEESRYNSKVDVFHFGYSFASNKTGLLSNIAKYYTDEILLLAESARRLLSDRPTGFYVSFGKDDDTISVKLYIDDRNLIFQSVRNNEIETLQSTIIANYVDLNESQIEEKIISFLSNYKLDFTCDKNEQQFKNLLYFTAADISADYRINSVDDLDEESNYSLSPGMLLLLRDLLIEKCKADPKSGKKILKQLLEDKLFAFPVFIKIALYVIKTTWSKQKSVFWNLLKNTNTKHYFSNYVFYSDFFNLLESSQQKLTLKEIQLLDSFIAKGPDEKAEIDQWQFRWYSALREVEPFKNKYEKLKNNIGTSLEDFRDEGKIKVKFSSGSIPPFTPEEMLSMSNDEILTFISNFEPDEWKGPSVDGLSDCLKQAVTIDPIKFENDLDRFVDLQYIYEYKIIHGFIDAWKNGINFDWGRVLNYCLKCIVTPKFLNGELSNPRDGWRADPEWVKGGISELISEGLRKDNHSFDKKFLPIANAIFELLISEMKISERADSINTDYVSFSINTTNGRILKGYLDYLLWRGRNEYENESGIKWNEKDKLLFEKVLENNILEAYTYVGLYFSQFYFLESQWVLEKVEAFKSISKSLWAGFFNGFNYGDPPANKREYELFYAHYKRAIENREFVKSASTHATIRHLSAFYLFGFEKRDKESLLSQFIDSANANQIDEMVHFISRQWEFVNGQNPTKKRKTIHDILFLWEYLYKRYKKSEDIKEQEVLGSLTDWIQYVTSLSESIFKQLITGVKYAKRHDISWYLLSNLIRLKTKGPKEMRAKYIGEILLCIDTQHLYRISDSEQKNIIELVTYIFKQNEYVLAVSICNKLAENYITYLNPVYEKYRNK